MFENKAFDKWNKFYREASASGVELAWPSETLIRLFKGNYVSGLEKDYKGKTVIDVGFGNGNNFFLLASLGLKLYGTEVGEEMCNTVMSKLAELGHEADLRVGTNRQLPFENEMFDYLVSWNVIHYEDTQDKMLDAISEYHRVLRRGGRFFLSTTGPEHKILKDSDQLDEHRYRIGRSDDFRKGEVYFYFNTAENLKAWLSKCFSEVIVGRTRDFLMTEMLDWFIATGVRE